MSAELLVNVTPRETRVALVENGVLQELMIERAARRGLVGNIFRGRVVRVLPGMQAAFVEIGLARTAFLHASDVATTNGQASARPVVPEPGVETTFQSLASLEDEAKAANEAALSKPAIPPISELLREGQELMVQVVKEPIGSKGARLTTHLAIPSCYLVYMPGADGTVGVSQRIDDEGERTRLRDAVRGIIRARRNGATTATDAPDGGQAPTPSGGYIVRTAAEGVDDERLAADIEFLDRLWKSISDASSTASVPSAVYTDLPLVVRTLREKIGEEIERARIDSRETVQNMRNFCAQFIPEMADRIDLYDGERPLFDLHGVEQEIQRALARKVELKSGGYLVIDQTEAMTTIDVNTGGFVGNRKTWKKPSSRPTWKPPGRVARQLRLRNLGGIIIADFIDMVSEEHKRQVLRALERYLERDTTRTAVSEVSPLGLVQLTRKRTRESLEHVLCEPCPTCSGRGFIKTTSTVCYEIFRDIIREARQYDAQKLLIIAAPDVIETIVDDESASFAELEAFVGRPITMQAESGYGREHYDVVLV